MRRPKVANQQEIRVQVSSKDSLDVPSVLFFYFFCGDRGSEKDDWAHCMHDGSGREQRGDSGNVRVCLIPDFVLFCSRLHAHLLALASQTRACMIGQSPS